jgi:hypothetical protein
MKKLLLILVLLFSLNSYAQSVIQTFAAQIGYWNEYTEKYSWDKVIETDVTFRIQNGYMFATDKNNSVYEIVKLQSSAGTEGVWSATDENGDPCTIILKYNEDDSNIIVIVYDTFCVKYYFE